MLGFFIFGSYVYAGDKPGFSLVKPSQYNPNQNLDGWVMSEKFDGVRAYWDGKQLLTKNGNVIHAPNSFIKALPSFELDGELWLARQQFERTASIVLDKTPSNDWLHISYQVFEVPNQPGNLMQRLEVMQAFLKKHKSSSVEVIKQIPIKDHKHLERYMNSLIKQGAEGLVIRDSRLPHQTGRQASIQKLKPKYDAECTVKGYTNGKGKYLGKVGAIICELSEQQIQQSFSKLKAEATRAIKIGSGLTDDFRTNPPKIGSQVTFQYMGFTNSGLPRFPVFLRVRPQE